MKLERFLTDSFAPTAIILIFLTIIFLFMLGCTAVKYNEPGTGSRARVRFAANTPESDWLGHGYDTHVYGYEAENCEKEEEWMFLRNGILLGRSKKTLGIPLWNFHKNAAKEVNISTDKPLIVQFKSYTFRTDCFLILCQAHWYICDVPVIYQLEERDYEISFYWDHYEEQCYANVFEIVKSKSGVYERLLLRRFDNKITSNNANCMKAFNKRRRHWSDIMFHDRTYK
jgi:hypothetical protein